LAGVERRKIQKTTVMKTNARAKPRIGESTIETVTLVSPAVSSEPAPAFATAAPARPPISACDELEGMP
jgi:hypothetical protein